MSLLQGGTKAEAKAIKQGYEYAFIVAFKSGTKSILNLQYHKNKCG